MEWTSALQTAAASATFLWAASACFTSFVAKEKGRSTFSWLFLGMVCGPLALFTIGLLPETPANRHRR